MTITATEFKTNFGKYMELVEEEDIYVTKNGKIVGLFSNPNNDPLEAITGILEGYDVDEEKLHEERIMEKYDL